MNLNGIGGIRGLNSEGLQQLNNLIKDKSNENKFSSAFENAIKNNEKEELKKASVEFESYFLNMMFKSMRKTVFSGGGIFQKSNAENMFQEMLDEEMAKNSAKAGGIGLADMMYEQLSKNIN